MITILLGLLLWAQTSFATSEQFSAPYPTIKGNGYGSNLVWALNSKQTIGWNTSLSNYNITLWQQSTSQQRAKAAKQPSFTISNSPGINTREWTVDVLDLDLNDSPVFLLWLDSGSGGFTSPFFNITRVIAPAVSVSPSDSTSGPSTATSSTAPRSTATEQGNRSGQPDSTLTSSAKVGLGVGIGIGVPLLVLLAAIIWIQHRKLRRPKEIQPRSDSVPPYHYHEKAYYSTPYPFSEAPDSSMTLHSNRQAAELDGTAR